MKKIIRSIDLRQRRRYNKSFLTPGNVVAYSCLPENVNSTIARGLKIPEETGILIVEKNDIFPQDMKVYEPTQAEKDIAEAFLFKKEYLSSNEASNLGLVGYLKVKIEKADPFNHGELLRSIFSIPYADLIGDKEEFRKTVWHCCSEEVGAVGLNFNIWKANLYTALIAVSMILCSSEDEEKQQAMTSTISSQWDFFSLLYSLFYGRNISTCHKRFLELFSYALVKEESLHYLHLVNMALGEPEMKISKILRYSPIENPEKLRTKFDLLKKQENLVEQWTNLDELFGVLFPNTFQQYLAEDNPSASIEELKNELRITKEIKETFASIANYARKLEKELGNAITIDELKKTFRECTPSQAQVAFSQLDLILEGRNSVWDQHRWELKLWVRNYVEQNFLEQGETYKKVQEAADYSKQAAEQPRIAVTGQLEVKNFEPGSKNVEKEDISNYYK